MSHKRSKRHAQSRAAGRSPAQALKVRSKKFTNALVLAVAPRPEGNTAQRSSAWRSHSCNTARTAPDRSSGVNIHSDAMVSPISASTELSHLPRRSRVICFEPRPPIRRFRAETTRRCPPEDRQRPDACSTRLALKACPRARNRLECPTQGACIWRYGEPSAPNPSIFPSGVPRRCLPGRGRSGGHPK
jgi:hypothetical protein